MKVVWTRRAVRALTRERTFIARENPKAANEVALRILDAVETVSQQPRSGRVGRIAGTREYVVAGAVVAGTAYILISRVYERHLQLLHVYSSRHDGPPT